MGGESKELSLEYLLCDVSCGASGVGEGVAGYQSQVILWMSILKMKGVC